MYGISSPPALSRVNTMNLTSSRIADGLRALGLGPGNQVMVHSSLKSLGMVDGGAPEARRRA